MSKLKLRGRIVHIPGPWGPTVPASGAKVKVMDVHPVKGTKHTIWSGTANESGVFKGTSAAWQDVTTLIPATPAIPNPFGGVLVPATPAKKGPDPTDIMLLMIEITVAGKKGTYPFPFFGDNVEVPVVVPWGPKNFDPNANKAVLNGKTITSMQVLLDNLVGAIEQRKDIELELYGPWSDAAGPIVDVIRETPLTRTQRVFPNAKKGSLVIPLVGGSIKISATALVAAASIIFAIAGAILIAGVATFVVCLGIAVILAVLAGYQDITAEQEVTTNTDGNTTTRTTMRLLQAS